MCIRERHRVLGSSNVIEISPDFVYFRALESLSLIHIYMLRICSAKSVRLTLQISGSVKAQQLPSNFILSNLTKIQPSHMIILSQRAHSAACRTAEMCIRASLFLK